MARTSLSLKRRRARRWRSGAGRPRARRASRRRKYKRRAAKPRDAREYAIAALRSHPGETVSAVAQIAKVSRTVANAAADLAREARKEARRKPRENKPSTTAQDPKTERRERAQRFLKDALAQGPKEVQAVEAAAAKAHIDDVLLTQARSDLGVIATRANIGAHAVQWSLPG
jgi:hypothetical protein